MGLPALARLAGLEPATLGLEGRCSIQLSYRRGADVRWYATNYRGVGRHSTRRGRGPPDRLHEILLGAGTLPCQPLERAIGPEAPGTGVIHLCNAPAG